MQAEKLLGHGGEMAECECRPHIDCDSAALVLTIWEACVSGLPSTQLLTTVVQQVLASG